MQDTILEGKAVLKIPTCAKLSKNMPVFYNPVMRHHRDVSVLLLKTIPESKLRIADPLAASGIRTLRFAKELPKKKISEIQMNDINSQAVKAIKTNLRINKVKAKISNKDANVFLLESNGFDYIDIDPFGSPNNFLDAAVQKISRNGIVAVTATDTAALCGTSPKACIRKYWAIPLHSHVMQEFGLRILIRKVQLIGAQYSKALVPIYSYAKDHYMRIFFRNRKGKSAVDQLLLQHGFLQNAGPMWLGKLWDPKLAEKMSRNATGFDIELRRMLDTIAKESRIDSVGFHDIHNLAKHNPPKNENLIKAVRRAGFKASATHFCPHGIRSNIPEKELTKILQTNR